MIFCNYFSLHTRKNTCLDFKVTFSLKRLFKRWLIWSNMDVTFNISFESNTQTSV